jgi:hypothetical protein
MTKRILPLAAAVIAALVVVLPAAAKTPPATTVAEVGIQVAQLGLVAGGVDKANASCKTTVCLSKSYTAFFAQAHNLDGALEALWTASGKSGACASAAVNAGAGFDSLTKSYHSLEAAMLKGNKTVATTAYGQIKVTTPKLTAILNSFKTKCM